MCPEGTFLYQDLLDLLDVEARRLGSSVIYEASNFIKAADQSWVDHLSLCKTCRLPESGLRIMLA